jgi:hypothetical protein
MAHAQKPVFVFRRKRRVHLNRRGRQFSRLLAAEVCASAVVMLDTPYSELMWRVLATHSIRQFPLHFPSRPSPCAITFQLDSTSKQIHCLTPDMPRPYFLIRSPFLYPEFTQTFDAKCYKMFTSNATHLNASCHELASAPICCFHCYAMRSDASPLLH